MIVSNDEYRDLIKENPQYRTLVDERLLMYSFVDGKYDFISYLFSISFSFKHNPQK